MHRFFGLVLLSTAVGFAAYSSAPSSTDREAQMAAISRIVAQGVILEPETVAAEQPGLRQPVLPSAPFPAYAPPRLADATMPPAQLLRQDALTALDQPSPPQAATEAWATTTEPVQVVTRNAIVPAAKPASRKVQRQLARQIQAELKRVGCYTGKLDGSWGDRSRSAMAAFIGRVNAVLPTEEPDVILLSLIKGHPGEVCGVSCPPDKIATGGRCVARTVVATAEPSRRAVDAGEMRPLAPLPGRMAIGGPTNTLEPPVGATRATVVAPAPLTASGPPGEGELPWLNPKPAAPSRTTNQVASPHLAALDVEANAWDAPRRSAARSVIENDPNQASPPPRKLAKPGRVVRPDRADRNKSVRRVQKKRRYGTRSVQNLFLHPLGRM